MKTLILKILPLLIIVFWATGARAQIGTTAASLTSCPGAIVVPVTVTNCNGIGAISLILNFDNAVLTYNGYQSLNPLMTSGMLIINATANKVFISWVNTTAANFGNGTLVELKFNAITSTSALSWDTQTPGNCEYSDANGNVLPSTFTNGTATINQPPVIGTQPTDKTVLVGQNTTFYVGATGTSMAYLWQLSTNGGGAWTDLTNVAPYSGVTTSTLTFTNATLTYNGYKYRCRITGTCTPVVFSDVVTLSVINPVTTTLPTASICPGSVSVPVTVTNFSGVGAFSLAFDYNPSCLTYTGYQTLNGALSGGTFVANASGGTVYLTWASTSGATIASGTIVEILFTGVAGTSPLNWDITNEGYCEYTAVGGAQITSVFVNGNQTIYMQPSVTSHPLSIIIAKGQNTSFSTSASGSGLSYLWQISTNGGGAFTNLANGGNYSNVTSATLNITNAQLAMSNYQYRCRVTGTCAPEVFSNAATLIVLPNILTTCATVTACPGQVIVPVNVTDFIGVASFSLALNFNPAVLTFSGYQGLNPALATGSFVINATAGKVYLTWSNIAAATIPAGGLLVELKFDGITGTSATTWDTQTPGNCEYSDLTGLVIFSSWTNGNATINSAPAITSHPVNSTIYASGSTSFSITATGTSLGFLWQVSTNGGASWTNLTNTPPYSGVNTQVLTINPASVALNGYLFHCVVSGPCTQTLTTNLSLQDTSVVSGQTSCFNATQTILVAGAGTSFLMENGATASMIAGHKISLLPGTKVNTGAYLHGAIANAGQYCSNQPPQSNPALLTVTQAAITTTPGTVTNSCTGNLIIPINVTNCSNVGSISLTMIFDTTKMTFEGYQGVNAALASGMLVVNRTANKIYLSWASTTTANIGAGTLIHYRFKAAAGISTTLSWDTPAQGACEYSDPAGNIITSFFVSSNLSVGANALIVNAGPDLTLSGSSVQLNGSATGGTTPYAWLWAPAGSLSSATIANPVASPTVTTAYTLTVTANNGCVGSDVMNVMVGVVPQDLTLQGISIGSGTSNCYNAVQTITVAGAGSSFTVQNGGSAIMIAGLKINYLHGTHVFPGGYMHGYITSSGQYCNSTPAAPVATAVEQPLEETPQRAMFTVYPNPTSGAFTLRLSDGYQADNVKVTLCGMYGETILETMMNGEKQKEFSLGEKPVGMYFVKVVCGVRAETKKVVKF